MTEKTQVGVKVIVDSNSTAETKKITDQLKGVGDAGKKAGKEAGGAIHAGAKEGGMGFAGAMLKGQLYFAAMKHGAHMIAESAEAPIEAYTNLQNTIRTMSGTLAGIDQNGNAFEKLVDRAGELHDELEDIGRAAGVTDDALSDAFNDVIARGGRSVEEATELTQQMAYAGRAVSGGVGAMSGAFQMMEMGMVRAKNPLVQMIANTGVLHGTAKEVAKQLQKMDVEKQMQLAEMAIGKMAEKMKQAPMTVEQLKISLASMAENLMETMGQPMVESMGRTLAFVRSKFINDEGGMTPLTAKLNSAAAAFGEEMGHAMDMAYVGFEGFMEGIHEFTDSFMATYDYFFGKGGVDWERWVGYAKTIGQIFGAIVVGFATGIAVVVGVLEKTVKYLTVTIGALVSGLGGVIHSDTIQNAGNSMAKAGFAGEQKEHLGALGAYRPKGFVETEDHTKQFIHNAKIAGQSDEEINKQLNDAYANKMSIERDVAQAQAASIEGNAETYLAAYNDATARHDEAAKSAILGYMETNTAIASALGKAGPEMITEGKTKFLESLRATGQTALADTLQKTWQTDLGKPKKDGGINLNGGQTFNIKQDFKDQDPDRIAILFREDITKHATNKLQAATQRVGF